LQQALLWRASHCGGAKMKVTFLQSLGVDDPDLADIKS
jgi:hypothetical protein